VELLCSFPPTFAKHLVVSSWLSSIIQELAPRFAAGSEQEGQLPLSRASLLQKEKRASIGWDSSRFPMAAVGSRLEYSSSQPQPEA
jgi:hypothetical protein